ncbi:MAG TPA: vanadium-dependent haloperoxidase [Thermoanaerobaculia bacterium]|nr:vanadium-dependent haloperoxidase [Thermoanaerobaculia bacterium]
MACDDGCYPNEYKLKGPQVEPAAGYWQFCARLRIVSIEELRKVTDDAGDKRYFPPYPKDAGTIKKEFDELIDLAQHRDDPCHLVNADACDKVPDVCDFEKGLPGNFGCRRPISRLWNLCPLPLGGVLVNRFSGEQVIRTGRGLARAVENETPGLYHRHIATFLMRTRNWSPPRQALVWAALEIAIASALQAAWYYKWLAVDRNKGKDGKDCTAFRERPVEYANRNNVSVKDFTVLFDAPDELNPAFNLCPDARPIFRDPDQLRAVSPGTPRHPAYPSGHSTYSAAASEILSFFFGNERTPAFLAPGLKKPPFLKHELANLADNIGVGRMWAGVHWRSDHEAGQKLGRVVACLVLRQLASMRVADEKGKVMKFNLCPDEPANPCNQCDFEIERKPCDPKKDPPKRSALCAAAEEVSKDCPKEKNCLKEDDTDPQKPCSPPPDCRPKKKKKIQMEAAEEDEDPMSDLQSRIDVYRGPQQGGN